LNEKFEITDKICRREAVILIKKEGLGETIEK